MKKIWIVLIVALILSSVLFVSALASSTAYVVTSNGKNLNVRQEPSKNSRVIDSIRYGTRVQLEYYSGNGSTWAHIRYGSGSGFVMSRYLKSSQPTPSGSNGNPAGNNYSKKIKSVEAYEVIVRPSRASGRVAMRWAATTESEVVQYYPDGYELKVIAQNRYWAQVVDEANGKVGYMYRDYITKKYPDSDSNTGNTEEHG